MTETLLTTAQAGFDAARRLPGLQRLSGHGFSVQIASALPERWAPYAGGEVPALQARLQQVVQALEHQLLDDCLPEPDDAALARWIAARLDLPVPVRVSVQSHASQGADWLPVAGAADAAELQGWRRFRFQSAHRLPHVPPGHKCGRMHGHGFQAIVHARGSDLQAIDDAWAPLHLLLNYRCLNDIDGLSNPTSENLAAWLWARLPLQLPGLSGISVFETASCGAHVNARGQRIWKDFSFDSATRLRHAAAGELRAGLHGHTYTLRLHLQAELDPLLGWAVDFGDVKTAFKPVFDAIDHRSLDDLPGLADGDCASLARWILQQARPLLPALQRVDLFETPGCGVLLLPRADETPILPASAG
jgi:6-pyruvoyltetrahydropterin/6-carboxytetrahydropterin synthase